MTDGQLLLLLTDWLESDTRLAPPLFFLCLQWRLQACRSISSSCLFWSALPESQKNWELDHGLGPVFGAQINLEVEAL